MNEGKISAGSATMLRVFAGVADLLSFILGFVLGLGWIIDSLLDPIVGFIIAIWFSHLGVSIARKAPGRFITTVLFKFFPVSELFPGWSYFVYKMIRENRLSFEASQQDK